MLVLVGCLLEYSSVVCSLSDDSYNNSEKIYICMLKKKKCSKGKKQVDGQEENAVLCKQTSTSVHNIDDPKFLLVSPITPALQWLHAEAAQQRQQLGSSALIITLHSSCLAFMVWYISEPSSLALCQKLFFSFYKSV